MKQLFRFWIVAALMLMVGCSKEYDDSALVGRVDDLESRVQRLEQLCQQMNTNISSLQTIVTALQNNDYVTGVTPITENGKTIGYTITFAKAQSITIYHGKDGQNGADGKDGQDGADGKDSDYVPAIGVKKDTDGIYYWTLDGEWLLDDAGNKIKAQGVDGKDGVDGEDGANGENGKDGEDGKDGTDGINGADGKDGITPQLKIENDYWYVSYDNGASWTQLGKATGEDGKDGANGTDGTNGADGKSFFQDVTQDDNNVYFTLSDGTVITVPKGLALSIEFAESDLVVMSPNSTREIGYTVTSATDTVKVEVTSSADIKAKAVADNASGLTGKIHVTTGDAIDEYSKVIVFVSNGDKVIMRSIAFEEAGLVVEENATKQATAEGGEMTLEFLSNVECEVLIPEDAQSWISVVPTTRAMEKQTITLKLEPNLGANREAVVVLQNLDNSLQLEYNIVQEATIDYQLSLEREALIAIYNALDGDNWTNNENWCTDLPLAEWAGVGCENYHVTRIDLASLSSLMKGEIPAEIGNLSHLKYISLNIEANKNFPYEIGNLKELEQAYLWMPGGETKIEFPAGLYDCTNLIELNITGTGVGGSLSPKIGQLKKLTMFCLSGTFIEGPVPEEIGELSNLQYLWIRGSGVIGQLPSSIGRLSNLREIVLGHMSGDIPKEIGNLSKLEILNFYSEYAVTSIPKEIYNLTNLKSLDLSFTKLPYSIPEDIGNLTELEDLCINYDLIGTIPESIGKLTKLKYMSLSNPFPQGMESLSGDIPISLQRLEYWPYFWADVISGHPFLNVTNLKIPALHIQAQDLNGQEINTHDIYPSKKLTIIYSWDDICPSVAALHPILKVLYNKYSEQGLEIIGYNGGYHIDQVKAMAKSFDLPWRNISTSSYPFNNGKVMAPGFITGLAIVVDSSGQIVYETQTGSYSGLEKFVEKTFNEDLELYESADYSQNGNVKLLQEATSGKGINVVLMGDAYSDRQISDGTYHDDMETIYKNLFKEEPYLSFKDYFNIKYVTVVSKNEGYGTYNETALSGYFGDGTLVGGNDNAVFNYALKAISEEEMDEALLIVSMNSDNYAGTCYMYYPGANADYGNGVSVSYFPRGGDAETFAQLLHHEACGHGFAKLADEYAYESMGAAPSDYVSQIQSQQNSWGWWKNVDFTSDPAATLWSKFINDTRYANEGLGAYEGGLTYWTGVWRPTENSIMRYNTGGFNAPSREAIYYRIHKLAYGEDWVYDYEDFVEWDARNRTTAATRAMVYKPANYKPTHPPVIVNKSWRDAK